MSRMVRRHDSLSSQQQTVLQWIAEGCPDGVVAGSTYKTTSYSLRDRGLVTVNKRRGDRPERWDARCPIEGRSVRRSASMRCPQGKLSGTRAATAAIWSSGWLTRSQISSRNHRWFGRRGLSIPMYRSCACSSTSRLGWKCRTRPGRARCC